MDDAAQLTPDQLLAAVVEQYDDLKYGLLRAQTFDPSHYGFPAVYYRIMETDRQRVGAFAKAFALHGHLRGATVCEVGVGTLPLTKLYMPYVKKAYLIENNPALIEPIKAEVARHDWADKVEVIFADALTVTLPEPIDFLIGELMSIYCANELQVQIFQHMRQFLAPSGKTLPHRIVNFARLCEAEFDEGISHYPVMFTRHQPMFLTQQFLVNEIELWRERKTAVDLGFSVPVLFGGEVNALYLESYVEITPGANFTGTDSLMPPTVVRTTNTQAVVPGDLVHVDFDFAYGRSLEEVSCVLS